MIKGLLTIGICLTVGIWSVAEACTNFVVTKGASATGSVFVSHSNDAATCDPSITFVPAKNYPKGSMRKIYPSAIAWEELPEYNCYMCPRRQADTIPLGEIPQVGHTYAYLDADYGIVNEYGLMLGECTNNSRIENTSIVKGKGIFYAAELGRVALERCKKAREAVELMGALIDKYGLYATAETLIVADMDEAWILEMQPTPSGEGGFWVAQKIPDGEFFVAANQFRIRELSKENPDQIFNANLLENLGKIGWAVYDEESGKMDWVKSMGAVEDYHPYFCLRRVWRAFDLVAPSKNFSSKLTSYYDKTYPFSVKPDNPITREKLMQMHRDFYQGTEFDLTKGVVAGPFGNPLRYGKSHAERSIASGNSTYTWMVELNKNFAAPIAWIALTSPGASTFVPLTVGEVPKGYDRVNRKEFEKTVPWWNYLMVSEFTFDRFGVVGDVVQKAAEAQEKSAGNLLEALAGQSKDKLHKSLNRYALQVQKDWQKLYGDLLAKYNQLRNADCREELKKYQKPLEEY